MVCSISVCIQNVSREIHKGSSYLRWEQITENKEKTTFTVFLFTQCTSISYSEVEWKWNNTFLTRPFPNHLICLSFKRSTREKPFIWKSEINLLAGNTISTWWLVSHEDLFWHRDKRQLENGLFIAVYKSRRINVMGNKTMQSNRRSTGNANFAGFREYKIAPLLKSSADMLSREILLMFGTTVLVWLFSIANNGSNYRGQQYLCNSQVILITISIGFRLWSIRQQTHDWRHHSAIITKVFPLWFKIAESFEKLNNISDILFNFSKRDWAKDKVQKYLVEALNRYEKSSEIKPNTKWNPTKKCSCG